jgi:murein DD-endopeptidase MepM/ murein hydrolase activator NlpD
MIFKGLFNVLFLLVSMYSYSQVIKPKDFSKTVNIYQERIVYQTIKEEPKDTIDIQTQTLMSLKNIVEQNEILMKKLMEENKAEAYKKKFYFPLDKMVITSKYGYRIHPITGENKQHNGIDLEGKGDLIKASIESEVIEKGYNSERGNYLILKSGIIEFRYFHLERIVVKKNDKLSPGDIIGVNGKTGLATGDHLHFETLVKGKYVNPTSLLIKLNKIKNQQK